MSEHNVLHTIGLDYSHVCGELRGYQLGTPDAFGHYNIDKGRTIDDAYVDGVSITYGRSPRKHIWTYAVGVNLGHHPINACPCSKNSTAIVPPFIGSDH